MMAVLLRGALVEYSGAFLGALPNIVVFQFNPEQLARTITIPSRDDQTTSGMPQQETDATEAPPTESFTITAFFSAADDLGTGGAVSAIPRAFGIGPQLAALEKMVYPPRTRGGLIGVAIDAIGSALSTAKKRTAQPEQLVPRVRVPKILFIWGAARVLPVSIKTMTITENKFDFLLNPVQAEVAIGLDVASDPASDDVAKGALAYTNMLKDTQATLNLAKVFEPHLEFIIPF
jgi:hypothetical protein